MAIKANLPNIIEESEVPAVFLGDRMEAVFSVIRLTNLELSRISISTSSPGFEVPGGWEELPSAGD